MLAHLYNLILHGGSPNSVPFSHNVLIHFHQDIRFPVSELLYLTCQEYPSPNLHMAASLTCFRNKFKYNFLKVVLPDHPGTASIPF